MTDAANTPRTAAGRALLRESEGNTYGPDDRELFLEDILAIEAEAAVPTPADTWACGATREAVAASSDEPGAVDE